MVEWVWNNIEMMCWVCRVGRPITSKEDDDAPRVCPATPGAGGGVQLSVLRESCDATSIASGTARVAAVISWMLPRAPSPSSEEEDPSGLMDSSCELLSCVDARSASLHSCKVYSSTKRGISTRGTLDMGERESSVRRGASTYVSL